MHLTLEQAAEELDIPDEAFQLIIKLGWIRYAIPRKCYEDLYLLDEDRITVEHLDGLPIPEDFIYYTPQDSPDYLYENSGPISLLHQAAISGQSLPQITDLLEDFDGTFLRLATKEMRFHPIVLPISPIGLLANPLFSLEEITRFRDSQKQSLITFKRRADLKALPEPFTLPLRADDPCRAIVDMGNLYFKKHRIIPQPVTLRKFMIQNKETDWVVTDKPNNRRKMIEIEDHAMSYDSFNKRYQQYLRG